MIHSAEEVFCDVWKSCYLLQHTAWNLTQMCVYTVNELKVLGNVNRVWGCIWLFFFCDACVISYDRFTDMSLRLVVENDFFSSTKGVTTRWILMCLVVTVSSRRCHPRSHISYSPTCHTAEENVTITSRHCLVASDLPSVTCPAQEGGAQTVDRAEIMNQTQYILLVSTTTTLIILKVQPNRDSVLG